MPGYLFKHESIAIEGVDALQIRSLLDRQQFADPLGEAEALGISSAAWPLFGLLWPSGLQLARLMGQRPLNEAESILEIGCGIGLASLVSHRRGAMVTASDCHPLAGGFLLENLRLNGLPPMRYCHGDWSPSDAALTPSLRVPRVQGRFDLIIGSDVLYERDDGGVLPRFIKRHARPSCEVMVVDPDRGNRPAFNRSMAAMGFRLEETSLAAGDYKGRLLRYIRSTGAPAHQAIKA